MPAGEEGSFDGLKCAACNCHRNFHRKEAAESEGFNQLLSQNTEIQNYEQASKSPVQKICCSPAIEQLLTWMVDTLSQSHILQKEGKLQDAVAVSLTVPELWSTNVELLPLTFIQSSWDLSSDISVNVMATPSLIATEEARAFPSEPEQLFPRESSPLLLGVDLFCPSLLLVRRSKVAQLPPAGLWPGPAFFASAP
nr:zinc-finger homeodomain protein 2-like [Ipomoea trifida]